MFQNFHSRNEITNLMCYFRDAWWPSESITPKLHLLDHHVCPFLEELDAALGMYGEQGMESLHATMNSLKRAFISMPNDKERLTSTMKEHYIETLTLNCVNHLVGLNIISSLSHCKSL